MSVALTVTVIVASFGSLVEVEISMLEEIGSCVAPPVTVDLRTSLVTSIVGDSVSGLDPVTSILGKEILLSIF